MVSPNDSSGERWCDVEERLGRCMTEAARFIIIFYFVESFGRFRGRSVFGAGGDGTAGKTSDKIRRRRRQTMTRRRRRRRRKMRVDLFLCHSQLCGAACSSGCGSSGCDGGGRRRRGLEWRFDEGTMVDWRDGRGEERGRGRGERAAIAACVAGVRWRDRDV